MTLRFGWGCALIFTTCFAQDAAVTPSGLGGWFNTADRNEIARSWDVISGTMNVPMDWTGSFNPPNAGTTSAEFQAAVAARIDWDRSMGGVPAGILMNETAAGQAQAPAEQQAAFMMMSNGQLNHFPPTTWTNYTTAGAQAAGVSNLCLLENISDPGCAIFYVLDVGNNDVGHRRWILYPETTQMATGD